jgi:hypothetical protein
MIPYFFMNFIEAMKDPAQLRGLAPAAQPKKEFEIPTWLIVLVTILFIAVVAWLLIS